MGHVQFRRLALPLSILGAFAMPAMAADYTYTDVHGSVYNLSIGSNTAAGVASGSFDEYLVTLVVNTSANDLPGDFLDAAAVKVTDSILATTTGSGTPGTWTYVAGGTNSGGCDGAGGGFMCESGHELIGGTFTFTWDMFVANGSTLFGGGEGGISLKAVYNAGPTQPGFYQISTPVTPVTAVPEPGTYAMMFAGLGVIGFMARRRRQQA
jgi:hypothetical protein